MKDDRITHNPAPAGALDASSGCVELLLEVVNRAEGAVDGFLKGAVVQDTSIALVLGLGRREILPEQTVVDMPWRADTVSVSTLIGCQDLSASYETQCGTLFMLLRNGHDAITKTDASWRDHPLILVDNTENE